MNASKYFIGWKGSAFHFKTPSGAKIVLTGGKIGITNHLKTQLPAWYSVAVFEGRGDLAADIQREAEALGISL